MPEGQRGIGGTPASLSRHSEILWLLSDDVSKMAFLTMTLHQGGATRMYEVALDKTQPALLSTFSGDRRFSRFGSVLHLTDLDDDGLGKVGTATLAKVNSLYIQWTCVQVRWPRFCPLIDSPLVQGTFCCCCLNTKSHIVHSGLLSTPHVLSCFSLLILLPSSPKCWHCMCVSRSRTPIDLNSDA